MRLMKVFKKGDFKFYVMEAGDRQKFGQAFVKVAESAGEGGVYMDSFAGASTDDVIKEYKKSAEEIKDAITSKSEDDNENKGKVRVYAIGLEERTLAGKSLCDEIDDKITSIIKPSIVKKLEDLSRNDYYIKDGDKVENKVKVRYIRIEKSTDKDKINERYFRSKVEEVTP